MKTLRPPAGPPNADDTLRKLFAQRAGDVASAPDVATVAVGRARRISRRRTSIGGVAAAIAFVLTLGTTVSLRGWWITDENGGGTVNGASGAGAIEFDAQATQQAIDYTPVVLRVDVSLDNRIYDSATGNWLVGGTDPTSVVRIPLGWLAGDRTGIHLVTYDGTTWPVVNEPVEWTVSGDGSQIATVSGTKLSVRHVTGHGATESATTTVPLGDEPIGFVGSTVVLTSTTGKVDAWRPGGTVDESEFTYVYGSGNGQTFGIVASPGSGRPCLAKIANDPAGGLRKVAMAGCHDLLAQGSQRAAVSPDGQHLAMPFDGGMWIINLARSVAAAASNPSARPVWVATCASDGDATPVWQDATTVVTTAHGAIISCGVDGVQRDVRLPKDVNASAHLVPRRVV